jgi:ABC-type multidrug transport system fused ATPase/permease subunit
LIAYTFELHSDVQRRLQEGIKRNQGRRYVFTSWEDIKHCLQSFSEESPMDMPFDQIRVLVLNCDADMCVREPMPRTMLPPLMPHDAIADLQSRSMYLETDLDSARIVHVRNTLGDDITESYAHATSRMSRVWRFLSYLRPHWQFVAIATVAGIFKFLVPLSFPWMLRVVIDDIVYNTSMPPSERSSQLVFLVIAMVLLNVIWLGATWVRGVFTGIAGHRMIRDLRVALFGHLQRLSHHFFAVNQSGAIVSRVVGDIAQAQNLVGSALTNLWMDLVLMVVLLAILIPMNWELALVALILMPIFLASIQVLGNRIRLSSIEVQQRVEVLSGGLQEKVAGIGIVKGFTREQAELSSFQMQSDKLYSKVLRSVRYATANEMAVGFVVMTSPVLVVWYGAHLIMAGELTVGQLTQFLLYLAMFYAPIQRMSDLGRVLATSMASIERVFEYFDTMPQVAEKPNAIQLDHPEGRIELIDVSFGYDPSKLVAQNINLTIEPGETVAFVGPSGSGKSTLANLIPRFYDPLSGVVKLDGHDLRDISIESLRRNIGIVNQDTILFSGTIRENLLLARPDATPEEMQSALEASNASPFVADLPEGLWTEIGERGVGLSGGQRQRLALARAFLRDPRILILDEATSALDSRSERLIQEALTRLLSGRTSIVIAHRLSTVLGADKIITLDGGRIVEMGDHNELLELGGLYSQLFHEQFGHAEEEII